MSEEGSANAGDRGFFLEAASVSSRHYFTSQHLWSSRHYARLCAEIERDVLGKRAFDMEHYSHAVSAVLSAVTFLETLVNEIFQDAADGQYRRLGSLSQQATDIMKEFWNASEAGGRHVSVLDKFQLALLFAGKARFEPGGALYQNASLLIYVRNRLVHFRPQTVTHGEQMGEERRLRGKFADNALMANMRNPWFPSKCIGAGCAEWSWKSSLAFANEWIDRLGVTRVFESDLESYPEP